ncbi:MAG: NUDIX hydrolase [Candidatus Saccharibacteria bacterium]
MERTKHLVSCKIALFNSSKTKILLVRYSNGTWGLPGGHLESDEKPESAILRELQEEIGIKYSGDLKRVDFWLHDNGKLILGFVGQMDEDAKIVNDGSEFCHMEWVDIEKIKNGDIHADSYDEFILGNA